MRAGQRADEKLIRDPGNRVRHSDGLVLWRAWGRYRTEKIVCITMALSPELVVKARALPAFALS